MFCNCHSIVLESINNKIIRQSKYCFKSGQLIKDCTTLFCVVKGLK